MAELYVVHCVDTEGPMYEPLKETFNRIEKMTGIYIKPSCEMLEKIQNGEYPLNGYEDAVKIAFSKRVLEYKKDWSEIDSMLDEITGTEFRDKYKDSFGNEWTYTWFIMDWAPGLKINPRRRDIGYNNIYAHYKDYYECHGIGGDAFEWHAHPMSTYQEAHKCATSFINSPHVFESMAHRVIDCGDFPRCFRPGFHTERPDSHWFLEQFIPFDFGNQAVALTENDKKQTDVSEGRFGDWRRALATWDYYHPAHDDYQEVGNCNRYIFRCLNVGTRLRLITQEEINKAFERVHTGKNTVLAFCDHDYRNMKYDVDEIYSKIVCAHKLYPDVKWKNATAFEAAKAAIGVESKPFELKCRLEKRDESGFLTVETISDTFGPQPFLAIKTKGSRYFTDNFDFQIPKKRWTYTFDEHSIPLDDIDCIGVASNSAYCSGMLAVLDSSGTVLKSKYW